MFYFNHIYQLFKEYTLIYTLIKLVVDIDAFMSKEEKLGNQIF